MEKVERMLKIGMQFFAEPGDDDKSKSEGEGNPDEGNNPPDDNQPKDDNKGKSEKTFTQDQVNKMMAKEKNQGRNSVYKELGIDPKDEKQVAAVKEYLENQKTDAQKAAEKEMENNSKIQEAEQRVRIAEAKAELMTLGIQPQYVDDAVTLALSKTSDDDSDIKSILTELKTKYPVWFESKDDNKGKGTGSSLGSKNNPGSGNGGNEGLGKRLAASRKNPGVKKSYWS